MWTEFRDMHSGGDQKLDWQLIYIELPKDAAIEYFKAAFGRDPDNVTCDCCGEDYSVTHYDSLREATAFERGCAWVKAPGGDPRPIEGDGSGVGEPVPEGCTIRYRSFYSYLTLEEFVKGDRVKLIYAADIAVAGKGGEA